MVYSFRMGREQSFAADVPDDQAAFMASSQVPWGVQALEGRVSEGSVTVVLVRRSRDEAPSIKV